MAAVNPSNNNNTPLKLITVDPFTRMVQPLPILALSFVGPRDLQATHIACKNWKVQTEKSLDSAKITLIEALRFFKNNIWSDKPEELEKLEGELIALKVVKPKSFKERQDRLIAILSEDYTFKLDIIRAKINWITEFEKKQIPAKVESLLEVIKLKAEINRLLALNPNRDLSVELYPFIQAFLNINQPEEALKLAQTHLTNRAFHIEKGAFSHQKNRALSLIASHYLHQNNETEALRVISQVNVQEGGDIPFHIPYTKYCLKEHGLERAYDYVIALPKGTLEKNALLQFIASHYLKHNNLEKAQEVAALIHPKSNERRIFNRDLARYLKQQEPAAAKAAAAK